MNIKNIIKHFILREKIPFPANLYYWLLEKLSDCKECLDGVIYPQYGVAPHVHNLQKTGSIIGSTEIIEKKKWPDNYADYDNGCGVYYCSNSVCKFSKRKYEKNMEKWSNDKRLDKFR